MSVWSLSVVLDLENVNMVVHMLRMCPIMVALYRKSLVFHPKYAFVDETTIYTIKPPFVSW